MEEELIEWLISDSSIEEQSQLPLAAVVFMLVYGMELTTFLLKTSDAVVEKFPLRSYDVGQSSVHLAGSAAHGLFPNTINLDKDIDVAIKINKLKVREKCHYDESSVDETFFDNTNDVEEERDNCEIETFRFVYETEDHYLNIELKNTPSGYIKIRRCRKRDPLTFVSRYVSSKKTMDGREAYWNLIQAKILQPVVNLYGRNKDHEPILAQMHQEGPALNAFIIDDELPMTLNLQTDLVFALPYPGWPQEADTYFTRPRKSG